MNLDSRSTIHNPRISTGLSYGILSALDPDQRKAAEVLKGQLCIHGGPGTGKTRTLIHRIAHLVTSKTARPENCLFITLSQWSRQEVIRSLDKLIGKNARRVHVLTMKEFGLSILEDHHNAAGLPKKFRVAQEFERRDFAVKALKWAEQRVTQALKVMAETKSKRESLNSGTDEAVMAALFEEWREHEGWIDEEDLLGLPAQIFEENSQIAAAYQKRYPFVSVDDYQNMTAAGYQLLRGIVKSDGNLCVSGDANEAVCCFRGADTGYYERFERDYPFTHQVRLTRNYRFGQAIFDVAQRIIKTQTHSEDELVTLLAADPGQVSVHSLSSDKVEAEYVAQTIKKMTSAQTIGGDHDSDAKTRPCRLSDIAVLYRLEEQAVLVREVFEREGIAVTPAVHGVTSSESTSGGDEVSLFMLSEVNGREFPVVFVLGCEERLIPQGSSDTKNELAERRLFYLGVTRASDKLFLTHASKRLLHGGIVTQKITPFLKGLEVDFSKINKLQPPTSQKNSSNDQLDLF